MPYSIILILSLLLNFNGGLPLSNLSNTINKPIPKAIVESEITKAINEYSSNHQNFGGSSTSEQASEKDNSRYEENDYGYIGSDTESSSSEGQESIGSAIPPDIPVPTEPEENVSFDTDGNSSEEARSTEEQESSLLETTPESITSEVEESTTSEPSSQYEDSVDTTSSESFSSEGNSIGSSNFRDLKLQVIDLVNRERTKIGLGKLTENSELSNVAQIKSEDMARLNYFSHNSPTYGTPFDMLRRYGISYRAAGENIAKGQTSAQQVMSSWINSSGHRANILSSNFTQIGVGIAQDGRGQLIWTQQFIGW